MSWARRPLALNKAPLQHAFQRASSALDFFAVVDQLRRLREQVIRPHDAYVAPPVEKLSYVAWGDLLVMWK